MGVSREIPKNPSFFTENIYLFCQHPFPFMKTCFPVQGVVKRQRQWLMPITMHCAPPCCPLNAWELPHNEPAHPSVNVRGPAKKPPGDSYQDAWGKKLVSPYTTNLDSLRQRGGRGQTFKVPLKYFSLVFYIICSLQRTNDPH